LAAGESAMSNQIRIAAGANTMVPAYLTLLDKGYQVSRIDVGEREETWQALKGDEEFFAEEPMSLLGLVALFESRGANWRATDDQIDEFLSRYP
jgi:hypothetical protein